MCCVRRVCAAAFAAAALSVCCPGLLAAPAAAGDDVTHILSFSGGDLWRNGAFVYGGFLWSPNGLDREGFALKTVVSGGTYRYWSGALGADVTGRELVAQFLPGWVYRRGALEVKVFAGLDLQDHRLLPDDPGSRLRGGDAGLRVAADLWYEPTPATMLAADGSVSTIVNSYSARIAYGWRLFDRVYGGPEAQTFASDGYSQVRFGAHLTSFTTGAFEWSGAAGWANDSDHRASLYVRFGVLTRR